jgi:hypothetical protein
MSEAFNSKEYWEQRYKSGGNSGVGSQGIIAEFKANTINNFVKNNNIQTVCELGCGDWLFELFKVPHYVGYDVSTFVIERNRVRYGNKYVFTTHMSDLTTYDLTISMDVILHLMEENVYQQYIKDLFRLSDKFVIIYSTNRDEILGGIHNKYRKFLPDVPENFELIEFIDNPHKGPNTQADFFIFQKYGK